MTDDGFASHHYHSKRIELVSALLPILKLVSDNCCPDNNICKRGNLVPSRPPRKQYSTHNAGVGHATHASMYGYLCASAAHTKISLSCFVSIIQNLSPTNISDSTVRVSITGDNTSILTRWKTCGKHRNALSMKWCTPEVYRYSVY